MVACRIVYGAATAQSLLQFSCSHPSGGDALQSLEGAAAFSAEVRPLAVPLEKLSSLTYFAARQKIDQHSCRALLRVCTSVGAEASA